MKEFEIYHEPSQTTEIKNEKEINDILASSIFTEMLMRLNVGESMYHTLSRSIFTRIK